MRLPPFKKFPKKFPQFSKKKIGLIFGVVALVIVILNFFPPGNFPTDQVVAVEPGDDLKTVSQYFGRQNLVRSPLLFRIVVRAMGGERDLPAGYYQFESPLNVISLARRVIAGRSTLDPVRVSIIEGFTNNQIARALARSGLAEFNQTEFLAKTKDLQGLLFPATYFFPSHISTDQVVTLLRRNFDLVIKPLELKIRKSGRTLEEVVTMASIIEREASNSDDRRQIAGILWKRYDADHKLQVDVARVTYKEEGLPEKPIANPSLDAIEAALEPVESPFWFYLSDNKGITHYAVTYNDHKKNIRTYLQ